jgi:hypothetical protein
LIRAKFVNNLVLGGRIFSTDVRQLTIQNNVVLVPSAAGNHIPLQVQRGGESLLITGNLLVSEGEASDRVRSGREFTRGTDRRDAIVGHRIAPCGNWRSGCIHHHDQ